MENYTQNIELINSYLNKKLSESEIQNFENRLKTDSNFNTLFDEHKTFLEGIKRQQLKKEIVKGKQTYIKVKWMKFLGISISVLAIVTVLYFTISNKSIEPIQNENLKNNSMVVDTIPSKKIIEASIKIDESIILKDSVSSKQEVVKVEVLKPIKNIETSLIKTPQKLKVNTQKDTVLVLKEGTKLIIKANSFVDTEDNLINGTIDLNVTEYYKLSDMLLANLSTTSNGKQLETGGMLYVEAKKDEANLKLGENSSIEILFPTVNKKEGMQLFSGEWKNDIINWQLEKKTEEVIVEEVDEDFEVPFAVIEEVPIYPGCENGSNVQKRRCTSAAIQEFVQRNFNTRMAQSIGLIGRQRANVIFKIDKFGNITSIRSRGTHPLIEQEANRVIASLPKMIPGKQRGRVVTVPYSLPIIFTIFEATEVNITLGEINSVPLNNQVEYDTLYTSVRGKVEQIRAVMHDKDFKVDSTYFKTWESYFKEKLIRIIGEPNNKKVILRKPLFEKENTRFKILEDDSISRGGHVIRKVWNESHIPTTSRIMRLIPKPQIIVDDKVITEEEFKKRLQNPNDNKTITTKAINNYAMSVLDLGWINLDRFIKNSNTVNYKIKVENRNGGAKVSMVFKSLRSILPSRNIKGHFSFGRVTKKEDVTLVAIKKQNGKLYLDIVDTKTKENPDLEFNFKEVSLEEMKNELEKLDKLF